MRRKLLQQMLNDVVIGTGNAPTGITQHPDTHTHLRALLHSEFGASGSVHENLWRGCFDSGQDLRIVDVWTCQFHSDSSDLSDAILAMRMRGRYAHVTTW
jgi:hypothetical protein